MALKILGYLCYLFAIIDFCGMFFNYDLTGVVWSPIVAGIIGSVLIGIAEKYCDNDDDKDED